MRAKVSHGRFKYPIVNYVMASSVYMKKTEPEQKPIARQQNWVRSPQRALLLSIYAYLRVSDKPANLNRARANYIRNISNVLNSINVSSSFRVSKHVRMNRTSFMRILLKR